MKQKSKKAETGKATEQTKEETIKGKKEKQHTSNGSLQEHGQKKENFTAAKELEEQITEYQKKADSLQASLDEVNDKFLRLFSEFDNYRKRMTKERIALSKTASEEIITALLPVLDDLERAAEAAQENEGNNQQEKDGVVLIYNKFKNILRQKGVEELPSVGSEFNTDYHEAITHIPADKNADKGKVVEAVQKGYMLNGKVIRYARVVVAN